MPTPAQLLAQSLAALRDAKHFSHTSNSYRKDNPNEYAKVLAYLDGGVRPAGVTSEMGKHALLEEDVRRALSSDSSSPGGQVRGSQRLPTRTQGRSRLRISRWQR